MPTCVANNQEHERFLGGRPSGPRVFARVAARLRRHHACTTVTLSQVELWPWLVLFFSPRALSSLS